MRRVSALTLLVAGLGEAAWGCKSGDAAWTPPETICSPGATRCFGNYVGTCAESGKSWDLVFCGTTQYCDQAQCRTRACAPGSAGCDGDLAGWTCDVNGASRIPFACKATGEQCIGGKCLPVPCGAGETECLADAIWTCTGGGWESTPCAADEACANGACTRRICIPGEARCGNEKAAGTCNDSGTDWVPAYCGEHEVCTNGFCFEEVAQPPAPDAVADAGDDVPAGDGEDAAGEAGDGGIEEPREDLPQIEAITPGVNKAVINGVEVKFLDFRSVNWILGQEVQPGQVTPNLLMITLHSKRVDVPGTLPDSRHMLEIRISGDSLLEGQTGTFRCEEVSDYTVEIWHRYGKYPQGEKCKDFDYEAETCLIVIEEFGPVGGRVKGTFTNASLVDCQQDGTKVTITDGVFDIER